MSIGKQGIEQVVAHEDTHVSGGADDIDSALADAAIPAAIARDAEVATAVSDHADLATVHQDAPTLISDHAGLPTVHQDAPTLISDHAGLPTVHQDAPALIAAAVPTYVRKTSNQTVNNSETLVNDTQLLLPIAINEVWLFELNILFTSPANADLKIAFTAPAGVGHITYRFVGDNSENTTVEQSTSTGGTAINIRGRGVISYLQRVWGQIRNGGTAGNLQFQFAQVTAQAADTIVLTNSYLIARKIA